MSTLRVEGVTVRFGEVTAVNDVSLSVSPGVTGLIGPNGAGKTTLFDVISGLRRPSSGRVLLDEEDITAKSPHQRSRLGVARTFQRLEVFGSLTVWENVVVALESRRRSIRLAAELLERVGIAEFASNQADTVPTGAARLPPTLPCCCSTSRRPGSTAPRPTHSVSCCGSWWRRGARSFSSSTTWIS